MWPDATVARSIEIRELRELRSVGTQMQAKHGHNKARITPWSAQLVVLPLVVRSVYERVRMRPVSTRPDGA